MRLIYKTKPENIQFSKCLQSFTLNNLVNSCLLLVKSSLPLVMGNVELISGGNMKLINKTIIISLLAISTINCGAIKIDTDVDDAVDKLTGAFESYVDDSGQAIDIYSGDDVEDEVVSEGDSEQGFEDLSDYDQNFIGTFNVIADSCDGLPASVRLYSYDDLDYIDFEGSEGILARADVFSDNTFDFQAYYRDNLERLTGVLSCSCSITTADVLICNCSDEQESNCNIYGNKQ